MNVLNEALKSWIPFRLSTSSAEVQCEWLFAGEKRFTEPFFDNTISALRLQSAHYRKYKVLSLPDTMYEWSCSIEAIRPSIIIFHVSRCGSTLLSQLLGLDSKNIVLSEVPLFDEILRLRFNHNTFGQEEINHYLQAAIRFYGQKRFCEQEHLFIKADSWHLHFYEAYRQLFPGVPFVLLYRNPVEVLLSQQKQRGLQSVPGLIEPEVFGFNHLPSNITDLDGYMAAVLETYLAKMLDILKSDPLAFAFNYRSGIPNLTKKIYAQLSRTWEAGMEQRITERSCYHGKRPQEEFTGGAEALSLPPCLQPAIALYRQLDYQSLASAIQPLT